MDYNFMKLESDFSDSSSDDCEIINIVHPKKSSSASNRFGSHLSTQQCNNRNMRERKSSPTKINKISKPEERAWSSSYSDDTEGTEDATGAKLGRALSPLDVDSLESLLLKEYNTVLKNKEINLQAIEEMRIPDNKHQQIHPERGASWTRHLLGESSCNVEINEMISSEEEYEDITVLETPKTKRVICKCKAGRSKEDTVLETPNTKRMICKSKAGSSKGIAAIQTPKTKRVICGGKAGSSKPKASSVTKKKMSCLRL